MSLRDLLFQPGLTRLAALLFLFAAFAITTALILGLRAALRRAADLRRGVAALPSFRAPHGAFAARHG